MSTLAESPRIPLEVAENIIDTLGARKDVNSLRSCALTCRGWHPRARHHLMTSIRIRSKEDLFSISDYFAKNPHIAGALRSLALHPEDSNLHGVVPVYPLSRFPNLRSLRIDDCNHFHDLPPISFHPITLVGVKTLCLEELSLTHVLFRTRAELGRLLSALSRLRRLRCKDLCFDDRITPVTDAIDLARFRHRCSTLLDLTMEYYWSDIPLVNFIINMSVQLEVLRLCDNYSDECRALDLSELTHLHSLTVTLDVDNTQPKRHEFPALNLSELTQLHSLTFDVSLGWSDNRVQFFMLVFGLIIKLLSTASRSLTVLKITFYIDPKDLRYWAGAWDLQVGMQKCRLLEEVLLRRGTPCLILSMPTAKHNRQTFWSKIMHDHFPRLHESGVLQVLGSSDADVHERLGHDGVVTALAASPDSRYIVTGDAHGTIIIWDDTRSKRKSPVELRCLQSTDESITSLQFSETGDFLAATSGCITFVWRLIDLHPIISVGSYPKLSSVWGCTAACDYVDLSTLGAQRGLISVSTTTARIPAATGSRDPVDDTSQTITSIHSRCNVLGHGDHFVDYCGIAWSSSGTIIAAFDKKPRGNQTFSIWRHIVDSTPSEYEQHQLACSYDGAPYCATFAGDELLIVGSRHGTIFWWDTSSSPPATTEPSGALRLRLSPDWETCSVYHLHMSPLRSFLVAACTDGREESPGVVAILPRASNVGVGFDPPHIFLRGHTSNVEAVCISTCERYIATASRDTTVRLWSAADGELLCMFVNHCASVTHVVFSPDGRILASADDIGEVCLHDLSWFVDHSPLPSVDG